MDYKIIKADPSTGIINVSYLDTEGKSLAVYAIEVPIVNGTYIKDTELEALIQLNAPNWLLTRKAEAASAHGFDSIASQVDTSALQDIITANTPPGILNPPTLAEVLAAGVGTVSSS
jgi:hypothetical protein